MTRPTWEPSWHPEYQHVCFLPQVVECVEPDWCSGWYFADEAEQLNGPYGSAEDANDALKRYIKEFL